MDIDQFGPYRIVRKIGCGGMGTVYEGVNLETNEPAAIKLLTAAPAQQEGLRERFDAEVKTLLKLRHPNIVRLFGFGEQDGQVFYAMELVDGNSLEQELASGRRFDWREVTRIAVETCRALRHAHDRGVIHRDIKPANLLLSADGSLKLSDFGIARLFGNTRLTSAGAVVGTAEYMAPEQASGGPVDSRTDLYSLAGVMYVLLARRPLFSAKSLPEVLYKQQYEQPEPLGRSAADCPAMLEQIIMQLLEKNPDRRIPNPNVLARQLEAMERRLSLEKVESELPPTHPAQSESPSAPPDDLPETKVTQVFHSGGKTEPRETAKPAGRFTPVAEEELDRAEHEEPDHPLISVQTWMLAVGLLAVGLTAWYFLQPPSADTLHKKITARTAAGGIDALRAAEADIDAFLVRFSGDPRCRQLREYQKEIELDDLERRFELQAMGMARTEALTSVERLYLEAINYAQLDPQRAAAKLRALLDLYGDRPDVAGTTPQCLELARRRLAKLREQLDLGAPQHLALVRARLDRAEELHRTDPESARKMYQAVIELYHDKPWAANAVERARNALNQE